MKYQLSHNIDIDFTLSDDEFSAIDQAIKNLDETKHYAQHGQFWYGQTGRREASLIKNECFLTVSTRHMDIVILKSLEQYVQFRNPAFETTGVHLSLYKRLHKVLKNTSELCHLLNQHSGIIELIPV
jgi:hypothetical protein